MGKGNIVDIVTFYGLDSPGIESRGGGGQDFLHPSGLAFLYSGYRASFPGVKQPVRGVDCHPHLA